MIEVNTAQLDAFAAELRVAGVELRASVERGLAEVGKPIEASVRGALAAGLPQAGGLARGAAERVRVATVPHAGPSEVGVAVEVSGVGDLDRGVVRHPTFGRKPDVTQHVTPGLVTAAVHAQEPLIEARAEAAVDLTITHLEGHP